MFYRNLVDTRGRYHDQSALAKFLVLPHDQVRWIVERSVEGLSSLEDGDRVMVR